MLVEPDRESEFHEYLRKDNQRVLLWLDSDDAVEQFAARSSAGEKS